MASVRVRLVIEETLTYDVETEIEIEDGDERRRLMENTSDLLTYLHRNWDKWEDVLDDNHPHSEGTSLVVAEPVKPGDPDGQSRS